MSNNLAPGTAQTPGQSSQNGQPPPGQQPDPNDAGEANNQPPPISPEDQAALDAANAADADAANANGQQPPDDDEGNTGNRRAPAVRIQEVVAERNAAMDYGNYWRDQATRLSQQLGGAPGAPAQPGNPPAPSAPAIRIDDPADPQPTLADFNFDAAKWAPKHAEWTARAIQRGVTTGIDHALTTRDQRQEVVSTEQNWNTRVEDFRKATPDFDMVTRNPTLPITETMAALIMRSDLGPAVFHHLGKNPPEAARIARLQPQQQAAAIARIEGRIEATRQTPPAPGGAPAGGRPAPPPRTNAPPPPSGQRTAGRPEVNLATASLNDYLAARLPHIAGSSRGPKAR